MADEPTGTTEETEPTAPPSGTVDHEKEAEKWKALARKHEKQAKDNADAATRLAALEEANKTELQKANDRATASDKRADDAEARTLRLEVAYEKGLTAAQAKRLQGTTREELEADAAELVTAFGGGTGDTGGGAGDKQGANGGMPGKPNENLRGGGDPTTEPEPSVREVVDAIPRSQF